MNIPPKRLKTDADLIKSWNTERNRQDGQGKEKTKKPIKKANIQYIFLRATMQLPPLDKQKRGVSYWFLSYSYSPYQQTP